MVVSYSGRGTLGKEKLLHLLRFYYLGYCCMKLLPDLTSVGDREVKKHTVFTAVLLEIPAAKVTKYIVAILTRFMMG